VTLGWFSRVSAYNKIVRGIRSPSLFHMKRGRCDDYHPSNDYQNIAALVIHEYGGNPLVVDAVYRTIQRCHQLHLSRLPPLRAEPDDFGLLDLLGTPPPVATNIQFPLISPKNQSVKRPWTAEQDKQLTVAVELYGEKNWKLIADHVRDRNHVQCLQRWKKVLTPGLVKGPWTDEEDDLLKQLVNADSEDQDWMRIASQINGRTTKQCRERWKLSLDPTINREPWTIEEDTLLVDLHESFGNKWAEIKTQFRGRTDNAVKSRYKTLSKKSSSDSTVIIKNEA